MNNPLITNLVQLFFVLNPHIVLPFFLSMTQNYTQSEQRSIGLKMCLYSFLLGFLFIFGGGSLLDALGVPVSLFRVGGGLLLGVAAWNMLYSPSKPSDATSAEPPVHADIALSPLAFPMLVGPATLTKLVSMVQETSSTFEYCSVLIAFIVMIGLFYGLTWCGGPVMRLLGKNGSMILEKIGGILLVAMAAAMIFGGLKAFYTE